MWTVGREQARGVGPCACRPWYVSAPPRRLCRDDSAPAAQTGGGGPHSREKFGPLLEDYAPKQVSDAERAVPCVGRLDSCHAL